MKEFSYENVPFAYGEIVQVPKDEDDNFVRMIFQSQKVII